MLGLIADMKREALNTINLLKVMMTEARLSMRYKRLTLVNSSSGEHEKRRKDIRRSLTVRRDLTTQHAQRNMHKTTCTTQHAQS